MKKRQISVGNDRTVLSRFAARQATCTMQLGPGHISARFFRLGDRFMLEMQVENASKNRFLGYQ